MFSPFGQRLLQKSFNILRLSFVDFSSLPDLKNLNIVRTVEKLIESNTAIFIESPIHVSVQPIDVNDAQTHNKLTMTLYSQGKTTSDFQVKYTSKKLELLNKNNATDLNDVCLIRVPYHLNVNVNATHNASVSMSKLEGDDFSVKTQKGNVNISDLKAKNIKVETVEGNISSEGRLQASNIEMKTGLSAGIDCNNIMATAFALNTHAGPISVKSCYSDKSHFITAMGNIRLGSMHGSVIIDVIQKGNLHISSFSGNLQASLKSGDLFMHVSQLSEKSSIFIHEKGKVEVLILDVKKTLPATNLIADKIFVDDKILSMGRLMEDSHPKRFRLEKDPQNELHIVCKNGSINLKESDVPFIV